MKGRSFTSKEVTSEEGIAEYAQDSVIQDFVPMAIFSPSSRLERLDGGGFGHLYLQRQSPNSNGKQIEAEALGVVAWQVIFGGFCA